MCGPDHERKKELGSCVTAFAPAISQTVRRPGTAAQPVPVFGRKRDKAGVVDLPVTNEDDRKTKRRRQRP